MYRSICKRLLDSNLGSLSNLGDTQLTHLRFLAFKGSFSFAKCFASSSSAVAEAGAVDTQDQDEQEQSFMVSYLIDSCGLSPDRAVAASRKYSQRLRFDSSKKPDSVLAFFRSHGFSNADITNMVNINPLLITHSVKNLLPKLQFLYSIGFTSKDMSHFVSSSDIWRRSLTDYIIPLYVLFKDVLKTDEDVVVALKRASWRLKKWGFKSLQSNLTLLKDTGVPSSNIAYFLRTCPTHLGIDPDEFRRIVDEVKALGFDVSKSYFVIAVYALTSAYRTTRDRCSDIYLEWGFSQHDILSAFKRWPRCLLLSEKKLREALDFLVRKMGFQVKAIAECPHTLTYNFEKRIIPRCSVIHVLVQKGLIKRDWKLSCVVFPTEIQFLNKYVTKYPDIASHLLMVYKRKVDPFMDFCTPTAEME